MIKLNVKFLEEYKKLDSLIKYGFNSEEGVSEYLRAMDLVPYSDRRLSNTWNKDTKKLKHLRWVRNKLTHEADTMYTDFCTEEDVNDVITFYNRIVENTDPLHLSERIDQYATELKEIDENNNRKIKIEEKPIEKDGSIGTVILFILIIAVIGFIIYAITLL